MRRFMTAGLVGTAQAGGQLPPDDAPSDTMVGALAMESVERAYLLRAGATAVRQVAGYRPVRLHDAPEPAERDRQPFCNRAVEQLIGVIVAEQKEPLLVEALDRLRRSGQTLAPTLLPALLEGRSAAVREAALTVLGERGRWLSQFNPDWRWAASPWQHDGDKAPAEMEALWQEGAQAQRVEVLRRLRAMRPDQAREWLTTVWKREKADVRADLLKTLQIGLSLEDEPLLESALDDRAAAVREVARELLASLPGSAFSRRMRERAEQMLTFSHDALDAKPPISLPADWQRDAIGQGNLSVRGERATWLATILSMVPCAAWSQRFRLSPDALIAAVETSSWRDAVLEGWTRAAASFRDAEWALALWRRWAAPASQGDSRADRDALRDLVAPLVATGDLEAYAASYFTAESNPGSATFAEALSVLPTPWSAAFGQAFLSALRSFIETLSPAATDVSQWDSVLSDAAFALPPACFEIALAPTEVPESPQWRIRYLRNQLADFADTIRLRQQLFEEIPLP